MIIHPRDNSSATEVRTGLSNHILWVDVDVITCSCLSAMLCLLKSVSITGPWWKTINAWQANRSRGYVSYILRRSILKSNHYPNFTKLLIWWLSVDRWVWTVHPVALPCHIFYSNTLTMKLLQSSVPLLEGNLMGPDTKLLSLSSLWTHLSSDILCPIWHPNHKLLPSITYD